MKIVRQKKCTNKACGQIFVPKLPLQVSCSIGCAIVAAKEKRAKYRRKEDKDRREILKTRSDRLKEAQAAFNAFIRFRDRFKTCICCGVPLSSGSVGGAYDCGHYRSVGSAPHLRFDERNAHAQRKQCNRWGSGRAVDYRIGLIARIGIAEVEALESDQSIKKWTAEELMLIRDRYRSKLQELKKAERVTDPRPKGRGSLLLASDRDARQTPPFRAGKDSANS